MSTKHANFIQRPDAPAADIRTLMAEVRRRAPILRRRAGRRDPPRRARRGRRLMAGRIDPRISARRVAVRRAEGRRRLHILLGAVAVVVLIAAAWGLTRSPLLDLDHVRIDGVQGPRADLIREVVALETGTPMVDLDLGGVATDAMTLPWVETARAVRDWPGTVRITVVPRAPLAVLRAGDEPGMLVDRHGVVTGPAPADSPLPVIAVAGDAGLGAVQEDALPAIAVVVALPDDLRVWVEAVTVGGAPAEGTPTVGLDLVDGAVVRMGDTSLVDDKLDAVRAVLAGAELACIREIDVTVPDLTTVARDPACLGEAPDPEGDGDA
ncbi:MAG: FtsQ-type POTRA domain-containing protein [Acidimicrobiales bacterium]